MNTTNLKMKNEFIEFLNDLGFPLKYALNGLVGGIIFSIYKKSKFFDALRQIIIGGIVAGYFTPVIISKTSMDMSYVGFTSFTMGITGMTVLDSVYTYVVKCIKKWKDATFIINKSE